ncbi:MAG: P-II family nitrogen regulator [Butyrivibrio sp.]|nr:P-II family nitrogen regulator [Butyrivibrio sp.]
MNHDYELIMCIINAGFSQNVMKAATKAGARGGTIIHGRGTADPEAEQFFHLAVSPDKEVLLILVDSARKDGILRAINHAAGLEQESQGIAFSLPVDQAVGLTS